MVSKKNPHLYAEDSKCLRPTFYLDYRTLHLRQYVLLPLCMSQHLLEAMAQQPRDLMTRLDGVRVDLVQSEGGRQRRQHGIHFTPDSAARSEHVLQCSQLKTQI